MSTPYTLMRCRMKDLISCFYACKVPIDDDHHENRKASQSINDERTPERPKGPEFKGGGTAADGGGDESSTSWPSCEEEEYIVFCFRDDGGVHMLEERGSQSSLSTSTARKQSSSAAANHRKLTFLKDEKGVYFTNGKDKFILDEQKYETSEIRVDSRLISPKTHGANEIAKQEIEEHKEISGESSGSSTSSFAFPVIQGEWTGSPVLMPRPEGHHKSSHVCIQCCKF